MTVMLRSLVAEELSQPVDPRVTAMAAAIAAKYGDASRAVLFYGSCLRERQLDGLMLDFYLIVSDYDAAYDRGWLSRANALIPPNVFPFHHGALAAKYAVLSEADFHRLNGAETANVDRLAVTRAIDAVTAAASTLLEWTLPALGDGSIGQLWKLAFSLTFAAELRAERSDRSAKIVDADPERYERIGMAALADIAERRGVGPNGEVPLLVRRDRMKRRWRVLQWKGKMLSVVRLAKASATYAGGADYIVWKINRHAGTTIELKPWQRRHPLLAAISLLPRLLRSGAIR